MVHTMVPSSVWWMWATWRPLKYWETF